MLKYKNTAKEHLINDVSDFKIGDSLGHSSENNNQHLPPEDDPVFTLVVSINAGHECDPEEIQGLSHLVEHLVHLGSKLYPTADGFDKFINQHNGEANAYTATNVTNYQCSLRPDRDTIRAACQRFAAMLSKPLFELGLIEKEVEAVDTEHYMRRLSQESQGFYLTNKTSIIGTHPMSQFSCGSKQSFFPPNLEKSKALERLKAAAHKFVDTHYYGGNMTIVIQGPETLDYLQEVVSEAFAIIPSESMYPKDTELRGRILPYEMTLFNRLYIIKAPKTDGHELLISWPFHPSIANDDDTKALEFISNLIEKPGGLIAFLKNRGWIINLVCNVDTCSQYASLLSIYFELTNSGRDEIHCVIKATFSFLKHHLLLDCQKSNFKEFARVDKFMFETYRLNLSFDVLKQIADIMHFCKSSDIFVASTFINTRYNARRINRALEQLTPTRANFLLFTWDVKEGEDLIDELFQTSYRIEILPESLRQEFEEVEPYAAFQALLPNNPLTFLPKILPFDTRCIIQRSRTEKAVMKYCPMLNLSSPQGVYLIEVISGLSTAFLRQNDALLKTWVAILNFEIIPKVSFQSNLGTSVYATSSNGVLALVARGLQTGLLDGILALIKIFANTINEQSFNIAKHIIKNKYYQLATDTQSLTRDCFKKLLMRDHVSYGEFYEQMNALDFCAMVTFVREYQEKMSFDTLSMGSMTRDEESKLAAHLMEVPCGVIDTKISSVIVMKQVPMGERCLRIKSLLNPKERVMVMLNYYEADGSTPENVNLSQIISTGLSQRIFSKLRTQEQLGYLIHLIHVRHITHNKVGIVTIVGRHVDKHCPCYVNGRVDNFLTEFYESELKDYIMELDEETRNNVELIQKLQSFYKKYYLPGSNTVAKLTIQVVTGQAGEECECPHVKRLSRCKKCKWTSPIYKIGSQNLEIVFAKDTVVDNTLSMMSQVLSNGYFIEDIEKYHNEK